MSMRLRMYQVLLFISRRHLCKGSMRTRRVIIFLYRSRVSIGRPPISSNVHGSLPIHWPSPSLSFPTFLACEKLGFLERASEWRASRSILSMFLSLICIWLHSCPVETACPTLIQVFYILVRVSLTHNSFFTITAEILQRLLANFYCQYADRHIYNLCDVSTGEGGQFDNLLS